MAMAVYKKSLCLENVWSLRCINKRPGTIHSAAESFFWGRRYNSSFFFPTLSWSLSLRVRMNVVNPASCFRRKKYMGHIYIRFFEQIHNQNYVPRRLSASVSNGQWKLAHYQLRNSYCFCVAPSCSTPALCCSAKRQGEKHPERFHSSPFLTSNCEEMGHRKTPALREGWKLPPEMPHMPFCWNCSKNSPALLVSHLCHSEICLWIVCCLYTYLPLLLIP